MCSYQYMANLVLLILPKLLPTPLDYFKADPKSFDSLSPLCRGRMKGSANCSRRAGTPCSPSQHLPHQADPGPPPSIADAPRTAFQKPGLPDSNRAQRVTLPSQMRTRPGRGFNPWVGKIHWRRARLPTPVFLPGESTWAEESGGL